MGQVQTPSAPTGRCGICDEPIGAQALRCARCKKILSRRRSKRKFDRRARTKALKDSWDPDAKGFRCHYTGILLDEHNHRSPRYVSFDHRIPREESDVVVAAALVNDMKSDLTDDEFRNFVLELARHFEHGVAFNEALFDLKHFRR